MSVVTTVLTVLVALEFLYIMYLETIVPTSNSTSRVFAIPVEELKNPRVKTLFKNQGVYNGLIAVALLYGAFFSSNPPEFVGMLLIFILVVALYGGITSNPSIIIKQGGLPLITLVTLFIL